jgi:hypothetical protein
MTKYLNIALVYVADVCNIEGGWARNTPVGMNLAALSFMLFGTFVRVRSICTGSCTFECHRDYEWNNYCWANVCPPAKCIILY